MTQKGVKQETKKSTSKNIFNIATKKLAFNNPFLSNKMANKKEESHHIRFISLTKPEKVNAFNKRDISSSIVELNLSPRHSTANNAFNNSSNQNALYNVEKIIKNEIASKESSQDNFFKSSLNKSDIDINNREKYKKTCKNYFILNSQDSDIWSEKNSENDSKNFNKRLEDINKQYIITSTANTQRDNNQNSIQTTFKTLNLTTQMRGFTNNVEEFLKQDQNSRSSPPKLFPISGRLSLNNSNKVLKPVACRPQTASLLKEKYKENNENVPSQNNKTRLSYDFQQIVSSHNSLLQNIQTTHHQNHGTPLKPVSTQQSQPQKNISYDDGYNSQNLSSSSATSSSSSSYQCIPEDHSAFIIPYRRPQSSRAYRKSTQNLKNRQSVHLFQKDSLDCAFNKLYANSSNINNEDKNLSDYTDIQISKSLSGNDVEVDKINCTFNNSKGFNESTENLNNYKKILKKKDTEIFWLKNQLRKREDTNDSCFDQTFTNKNNCKPHKKNTEEDFMLRILELKKENEILNSHLETLETNLKEAYEEKDATTKELFETRKQLEKSQRKNQENLNKLSEMVEKRQNQKQINANKSSSIQQKDFKINKNFCNDIYYKKTEGIDDFLSTSSINAKNYYDNETSSKLASLINKVTQLHIKSEEDKQMWNEEKKVVIDYQRKLQEKILESAEEKWKLEREVKSLKIELEQIKTAERIKALSSESYC